MVDLTVPIFTGPQSPGQTVGLKIQLASDSSGAYVPVIALDSDLDITIGTVNQGTGGSSAWKVDPSGVTAPVAVTSLPSLPAGSNTIGTVLVPAITPQEGSASAIITGGTAVTLVTGPVNGGYITNPANATAQGISVAENAYLDPVGTPGSTDSTANGTTILLAPGQNFSLPPLASGVAVKANAATSGHKLTVVVW